MADCDYTEGEREKWREERREEEREGGRRKGKEGGGGEREGQREGEKKDNDGNDYDTSGWSLLDYLMFKCMCKFVFSITTLQLCQNM